jgi:Cof subfamily protein (haloacid dehalogenase superfamily)
MKQIKAICTDIDGTLLDANRGISPRLKSAIEKLPKDFPIILASSRMPDAMRYLQKDLDKIGSPMICYNGGYVIHEEGDNIDVLNDISIPIDVCEKLYEIVKKTQIHMSIYHADTWVAPQYDQWTEREIRNTRIVPQYAEILEILVQWKKENRGAHKVMCMGVAEEIEYVYQEAYRLLGDQIHLYRSKDTYIEIAPKQISKASALELLLKQRYNFGMESVMSFGDNYNDIDLLEKSGWGVAVGNAQEEVKQIANEVTLHHKEDGVAVMIEKFLINNKV